MSRLPDAQFACCPAKSETNEADEALFASGMRSPRNREYSIARNDCIEARTASFQAFFALILALTISCLLYSRFALNSLPKCAQPYQKPSNDKPLECGLARMSKAG